MWLLAGGVITNAREFQWVLTALCDITQGWFPKACRLSAKVQQAEEVRGRVHWPDGDAHNAVKKYHFQNMADMKPFMKWTAFIKNCDM